MLNGVISIPNVPLALINGLLIDRYGAARIALWSAAHRRARRGARPRSGTPYDAHGGRPLHLRRQRGRDFHRAAGGTRAMVPAQRHCAGHGAVPELARVGSSRVDTSTSWARPLYDAAGSRRYGWAPGITGDRRLLAVIAIRLLDAEAAYRPVSAAAGAAERMSTGADLEVRPVLLVHPRTARALRGGLLSRSEPTYAIEYFQHAKGLTLSQAGSGQSAGCSSPRSSRRPFRSARRPLRSSRVDAHFRDAVAAAHLRGARSHEFEPLGLHRHDGNQLLAGAGGHLAGHHTDRRAAASGYGTRAITLFQSVALGAPTAAAGWLADQAGAGAGESSAAMRSCCGSSSLLSFVALSSVVLLWRRETGAERPWIGAGTR